MIEFSVYDDSGAAWPPGFVSQLADPDSPHTMFKRNGATPEQATANRHRCASLGIGLGTGTIAGLGKRDRPPMPAAPAAPKPPRQRYTPDGQVLYLFKPRHGLASLAEWVWTRLNTMPAGARMADAEIARAHRLDAQAVRHRLEKSVGAGVLEVTRRGDARSYSLGPAAAQMQPSGAVLP